MSCQFGIYADREVPLDQSEVLIYQLDHGSPRATLNVIAPFLRTFHGEQGMDDTGLLGAALTWYLIDLHLDSMPGLILPKVEIVKEIQAELDFFYRISPGCVDVYRIDDRLEWNAIAVLEIDCFETVSSVT